MPQYSTKPPRTGDLFAFADSNRASILYVATNKINGKQYVGITRTSLKERMGRHFSSAARGVRGRFYNAIRKHGPENFDFVEIANFETFKAASTAEREKISELNPAYNVTKGGEGALGYRHPPELIAILANKRRGTRGYWKDKKRPSETIEKMRAAKLLNPQRYWLGKSRDQSTIDKIRASNAGRVPPVSDLMEKTRIDNMLRASAARQKRVICLTDGNVFKSARDASLFYGFHPTSVAAVCGNPSKRKAIYGIRFAYLDEVGAAA